MALYNNKPLPDENVCVDITTTPQCKPKYGGQDERTYNVSISTVIFAIMSLILWILGGHSHSHSRTSTASSQKKDRNRLQKSPRSCDRDSGFYSCQDTLDSFQAQSSLPIFSDDNEGDLSSSEQKSAKSHAQIADLVENQSPGSFEAAASSLYSKISTFEMKTGLLTRTRAKTPVFAVGQLERKMSEISEPLPIDTSRMLADQYRALLPPRLVTPFTEAVPERSRNRTLRKVKCQPSLRSLIKSSPGTPCSSDTETLVGSESPTSSIFSSLSSFKIHRASHDSDDDYEYSTSPLSSKSRSSVELDTALQTDQDGHDSDEDEDSNSTSDTHRDLGLQICLNLLTDELATAFFRQHPIENTDRVSGLQVLLMIEAYESVQQRVRQELFKSRVNGAENEDLGSIDRVLNHWLQALYGLYDHSWERERDGAE